MCDCLGFVEGVRVCALLGVLLYLGVEDGWVFGEDGSLGQWVGVSVGRLVDGSVCPFASGSVLVITTCPKRTSQLLIELRKNQILKTDGLVLCEMPNSFLSSFRICHCSLFVSLISFAISILYRQDSQNRFNLQ